VSKLDKISALEDAVSLSFAADEYLLEPLKTFCAAEIERLVTVENVWPTLNFICLIPKVAAACSKVHSVFLKVYCYPAKFQVLFSKTVSCLDHPSFLKASKESLIFLLQTNQPLNIKSELDLLNASLKLANSK